MKHFQAINNKEFIRSYHSKKCKNISKTCLITKKYFNKTEQAKFRIQFNSIKSFLFSENF